MPFGLALGGLGLSALSGGLSALGAQGTKNALQGIAGTPYVDPNAAYNSSLGATANAIPQAEAITGQENQFNNAQMQQALNQAIPGYQAIQAQRSQNIQDLLAGKLSPDVQAAIERSGAAQALAGGYGGSGAGANLTARDLGLTSLQLQGQGAQQAQTLISGTPMMAPQNVAGLLGITPSAVYGADVTQRAQNMGAATNAAVAPGALGALGSMGQTLGGAAFGAGGGFGSLFGSPTSSSIAPTSAGNLSFGGAANNSTNAGAAFAGPRF